MVVDRVIEHGTPDFHCVISQRLRLYGGFPVDSDTQANIRIRKSPASGRSGVLGGEHIYTVSFHPSQFSSQQYRRPVMEAAWEKTRNLTRPGERCLGQCLSWEVVS